MFRRKYESGYDWLGFGAKRAAVGVSGLVSLGFLLGSFGVERTAFVCEL